jgi:hypothetical protein
MGTVRKRASSLPYSSVKFLRLVFSNYRILAQSSSSQELIECAAAENRVRVFGDYARAGERLIVAALDQQSLRHRLADLQILDGPGTARRFRSIFALGGGRATHNIAS